MGSAASSSFVLAPLVTLLILAQIFRKKNKNGTPLPPGPPSDPIIGHLRFIPPEGPEDKYMEWAKTYGDVMQIKIMNRSLIILSSTETAIDLLEKRSANYSDRPNLPIFNLMGIGGNLTFLPYGKKFQKHRRLLQECLQQKKCVVYRDMQAKETRRLALKLLGCGEDKVDSILESYGTGVVIQVTYGHNMDDDKDEGYHQVIRDLSYSVTHCGPPGGTIVDLFPALQYFPSWFPGTFFANRAREFYKYCRKSYDYPFDKVRQQMTAGTAKPSFLSHHLDRLHREQNETEEEFEDLRAASATIYGAGSETMWSTMSVFILAMMLHPECQKLAQEEIDSLLHGKRLPEFDDRSSLPYLEAVLYETYRWLSATPLGMPHRAMEDDIYNGMFIPKGSIIFANIKSMLHDERTHYDPTSFKPSRYLPKSKGGNEEPYPFAHFGFGRRICPGRHLAEQNLWIAYATILSLFNIRKAKDENRNDITPKIEMDTGLTSHPKPFKCVITPRGEDALKLIGDIQSEFSVD